MLPSDFCHRSVVLSFQEDAIGIRLRDVIGPDNMRWDNIMWGPRCESADLRIVASHQLRVAAAAPKAIKRAIATLRSRPFMAVPVAAAA
jgi:hypothetical protein